MHPIFHSILSACAAAAWATPALASYLPTGEAQHPVVHHRVVNVGGLSVFYREAGPADAPVILLLHGFPATSHMYRDLIPALAARYHVIAPDPQRSGPVTSRRPKLSSTALKTSRKSSTTSR